MRFLLLLGMLTRDDRGRAEQQRHPDAQPEAGGAGDRVVRALHRVRPSADDLEPHLA
jgi:hypothetical protein